MSASQDARQVLLEISLLPGGSTQNFNAAGRGSNDQAGPSGDGKHMLVYWTRKFGSATWEELPELVERARGELDDFRKGRTVEIKPETMKERHSRILKDGRGWSCDLVSVSLRVSASEVRAARLGAGLDPATGEAWSTSDELSRARALKAAGARTREIADALGVSVGKAHKLANG